MTGIFGRVALVTGAAAGIGRQVAVDLAKAGARVMLADLSAERGLAARDEIRRRGGRAEFVRVDIALEQDVRDMVTATLAVYGSLEISVLNAGITSRCPFPDLDGSSWRRVLDINLTGTFFCARESVRAMLRGSTGSANHDDPNNRDSACQPDPGKRIIVISSASAFSGSGGGAHYAASKAGLHSLVRAMAAELAPQGILVNAVAPRVIESEILDELYHSEAKRRALAASIPVGRLGHPADVSNLVLFLASNEASYVSGQVMLVDGGRTALMI